MSLQPRHHAARFAATQFFASLLRIIVVLGTLASTAIAQEAKPPMPFTPEQARTHVDEEICVRMQVKSAKDRVEKRGEFYLDAESDFRDPKNFAVVLDRDGAAALRAEGITDITAHFQDQWIEATGKVTVVQDVPRIVVSKASQIRRLPANK